MKKKKKILFLVNDLSFLISHRLPIAEAAILGGFEVVIGYGQLGINKNNNLRNKGFKLSYIPMKKGGLNIFIEIKTLFMIWKFFKKEKPDIVHLITLKPYLYGGIISRILKIKSVLSAISGLGSIFIKKSFKFTLLLKLLHPLYKFSFNHPNQKVIIQNKSDLKLLVEWGVLDKTKVELIRGSGVNLNKFTSFKEPTGEPIICFAARLLVDKGLYEFIYAADFLIKKGIKARFLIAGDIDNGNPSSLKKKDLNIIKKKYPFLEFLGHYEDIPNLFASSNIICLPSYREGMPKTLIEAAAANRAIVTTDTPGCRDSIIPNKTGLLVPVKDYKSLAKALQWLIEHRKERVKMGINGRRYAEKNFSIEKTVHRHLKIYNELINN